MRPSRPLLLALASAAVLAAACGKGEEAPAPPASNPVREATEPTREAAREAEKAMQENEAAMNAQVQEAAGAAPDTARRP